MHFESYSVHAFYVLHMYFFSGIWWEFSPKAPNVLWQLGQLCKSKIRMEHQILPLANITFGFLLVRKCISPKKKKYFSSDKKSKIRTQQHFCHHHLIQEMKWQKFYRESEKFNNLKFKNKSKQQSTKLYQYSFVDIGTFIFVL